MQVLEGPERACGGLTHKPVIRRETSHVSSGSGERELPLSAPILRDRAAPVERPVAPYRPRGPAGSG